MTEIRRLESATEIAEATEFFVRCARDHGEALGLRPEFTDRQQEQIPRIFLDWAETAAQTDLATPPHSTWLRWGAFDGGQLVGTVALEIVGNVATMKRFYVSRVTQGKGVGRALINVAIDAAKQLHTSAGCGTAGIIDRVELVTDNIGMERANQLYISVGFVLTHQTHKHLGEPSHFSGFDPIPWTLNHYQLSFC